MSDKPHLPREKTEKATTQQLTTRDISPPTKPIKIPSVPRGGTSVIDTQIPKDANLAVTVLMGQEEIPIYVKPALSHLVNIGNSIIVKRCNKSSYLITIYIYDNYVVLLCAIPRGQCSTYVNSSLKTETVK